jgi:hypothetical protein
VVGCGLLTTLQRQGRDDSIFYTLNGKLLGTPFKGIAEPAKLRPAVGLHSAGERVRFELDEYAFDLDAFVKAVR